MGKTRGSRLSELNFPPEVYAYAISYRFPKDSDLKRISDLRSTCIARLAAIDDEIRQLELPKCWYIRDDLRTEQTFVKLQVEACDSLVAIHRQLPPELLVLIFQHYLDEMATGNQRARLTCLAVLCLVSHSWRAAAMSNPAFWSPVLISVQVLVTVLTPSGHWTLKQAMSALNFRMDLLKGYPWKLELLAELTWIGGGPAPAAPKERFALVQDALDHPSMNSLRRLTVECTSDNHDLLGRTFPSVDSLVIQWHQNRRDASVGKSTPRLPSLPRLQKAVLCTLPFEFFDLPISQLTHLYIGEPKLGVQTWAKIMHICTKLVRGCFVLWKNDDDPDEQLAPGGPIPTPSVVVQEELKELTLLLANEMELEPRATFHWPALTKFALYYGFTRPTSWMPALMDNLGLGEGRSPMLSHLTLIGDDYHDGSRLKLLQALPLLEELCLTISDEAEEIISWLSNRNLNLPRLRALGLRLVRGDEEWDPADTENDEDEEMEGQTLWRVRIVPTLTRLVEARTKHKNSGSGSLESLTLKLVGSCQTSVRYFKKRLTPVSQLGINIWVDTQVEYNVGSWAYELNYGCSWHHWDEGFQDFIEANGLCKLYPTKDLLHEATPGDGPPSSS
ncbi:hypothetical protein BKA70DRAFT_60229 [Coprinopsis sp. MPI-PUGE-AT-0042]|nr:hypothetical protein BKA70DRAFT_60229 [Coprinopsis sp. MPI-PUGE-AT-0042]